MVRDFTHAAAVFLFPGIGVKPCGREHEFYRRFETLLHPFFIKGSAMAGVDLTASLLQGTIFDNEQFVREIFAYAFSCGAYRVFAEKGLRPRLMAGHSLGIYAALVSSGALGFNDGLRIIEKAHQLGRHYSGSNRFGVGVIIGIRHSEVMRHVKKAGYGSVNLANLNSLNSGVYVGYRDEIDGLLDWAASEDAIKTIRLRIDIPFHNPKFMQEASADLQTFLQSLVWQTPQCPILSSLDHSFITDKAALIEMTAANLRSTIDWPGVITRLTQLGVEEVIECGAGVSLTQHSRFIESSPRHLNLKNLKRRLGY